MKNSTCRFIKIVTLENAFYYAIEPLGKDAVIKVYTECEGPESDRLWLCVRDFGKGISKEKQEELAAYLADDNYELAGWTIVSGASNCSFVYESLSVVILKAQGKCAIKANRVSSLLTLEAGIGGVVHSSVPTTSSISTLGLRISAKPVEESSL